MEQTVINCKSLEDMYHQKETTEVININHHYQDEDSKATCCECSILQKFHEKLTIMFYKLGVLIAQYPSYFIIFPVFICLLGMTGFQRMYLEADTEKLFYPNNGQAPSERALIEHYFPLNSSSHFLPYYITQIHGFARVLIEAKDKGSIFRKYLWDEMLRIDQTVKNITITYEEKVYRYQDVCAIWDKKCTENYVLELYDEIDAIENGSMKINYPVMIIPYVVPMFFGGIRLNENMLYIASAKAINLAYFLRVDTPEQIERAFIWEKKFISVIGDMNLEYLHVSRSAARSIQDATNETPEAVEPFIPIVVVVMLLFSVGNTMMLDWVRSKFYLGLIGLISAALATGCAFGYLMYLGVASTGINNIIPFLMIGIGLDDMFVMLAAWRRTSVQDTVVKRLSSTYADAGVSILITSLTNMVSFLIGVTAPIYSIRLFCIYTACSVALMYLVHMTFFGGCLAVSGYLERDQRHSLTFKKVKAKSEVDNEKGCYSLWCSGGINANDPWNKIDNEPHTVMLFFKNSFGKMLTKPYVKCAVIVSFLVYLAGGIYGFFRLSEGFDRIDTVRYDSYITDYIRMEDTLFRHHPYSIQVVITGDIKYSNHSAQEEIINLHKEFESLPYITGPALTQSWMRGWFRRIKRRHKQNYTSEQEFIKELRETYLYGDNNLKAFDVAYNSDYSRIVASRFFLQTKEVKNTNVDTKMMNKLREIAAKSPLNVTVFNPNFLYFDQYNLVKPAVIQATAIAAISMIIISLVFIPNKWCSLYVGFAIVSIEVGVIGYMALWSVSLNFISMISLIMCIGFSVDFSAHVSYSYYTSKAESPNEKIVECLYCLGLPILQGGLSTICSVIVFIFVPSYVYVAFFKVIFLVVVFASLHGLFLLPVLLSVAGPDTFKKYKSKNLYFNNISENALQNDTTNAAAKREKRVIHLSIDKGTFSDIKAQQERDDPEGCSNKGFSIGESDSNSESSETTKNSDNNESENEK